MEFTEEVKPVRLASQVPPIVAGKAMLAPLHGWGARTAPAGQSPVRAVLRDRNKSNSGAPRSDGPLRLGKRQSCLYHAVAESRGSKAYPKE